MMILQKSHNPFLLGCVRLSRERDDRSRREAFFILRALKEEGNE
jgi:hypothetical protein